MGIHSFNRELWSALSLPGWAEGRGHKVKEGMTDSAPKEFSDKLENLKCTGSSKFSDDVKQERAVLLVDVQKKLHQRHDALVESQKKRLPKATQELGGWGF